MMSFYESPKVSESLERKNNISFHVYETVMNGLFSDVNSSVLLYIDNVSSC